MTEQKYTVYIDDNFHYMDESERLTLGEYPTYEKALSAATRVVERSLADLFERGMKGEELMSSYCMFGEDPFIVPDDGDPRFSARDYAREQCRDISDLEEGSVSALARSLRRWFLPRKKKGE